MQRLEMKTTVQKRLIELNKTAPDSILRLDPYAVLCESRFYKRANVSWDGTWITNACLSPTAFRLKASVVSILMRPMG